MKEFKPKFTSGRSYDGFKLSDSLMLFSKKALKHAPKEFTILFDRNLNVIKLKSFGTLTMPKDGRLNCDFKEMKIKRGRYYHEGDEIYKFKE